MPQEGLIDRKASTGPSLKQKAVHEATEFAAIFLYLAFFFCALATYSMLLLSEFHVRYLTYAFALLNALVIAKVIMIGEYVRVGQKYEGRPLLLSTIYKALLFGLLVLAFHAVEEVIKRRIHGVHFQQALQEVHINELLGRIVVVFCAFIPLFAFREFRRVLGAERFNTLFFRSAEVDKSDVATK